MTRGTQPTVVKDVQVRLSHVVWAEDSEERRAYIRVGRGSRSDAAFIAVEVVACRRVSQCSDIRQCSGESQWEIKIERPPPIDAQHPENKTNKINCICL